MEQAPRPAALGQRIQFKFVEPGLYYYYDPTLAAWNTADARVAANKGVPNYPLAMEGVIRVKGPISNLPSATTNRIPPMHDDFASEFLAITPGSVSWHNFDSDPHFVALAPGWSEATNPSQAEINPTDIGVNRIAGTDDIPGGDTIAVISSKPGLYYYYCANHTRIDAARRINPVTREGALASQRVARCFCSCALLVLPRNPADAQSHPTWKQAQAVLKPQLEEFCLFRRSCRLKAPIHTSKEVPARVAWQTP